MANYSVTFSNIGVINRSIQNSISLLSTQPSPPLPPSSLSLITTSSLSSSSSPAETTESPWWMSDYPSGYSWIHIIAAAISITIVILLVIFGNFLVIWAITHDRTLKTTQNLFIASLAFADFFIGLLILPFSLTNELLGYWLFGVVFCEIYKALDVLLCTASIMSLFLISLDRYWSITRAVHYARQRTKKRAAVMIFTVWFISAVVSIPPLIGWKQPTRESEWPVCELSSDIGYVMYSAFGSFYIPATLMVVVLFKIYQAATQRARKNITSKANSMPMKCEKKRQKDITVEPSSNNNPQSRTTQTHVLVKEDSIQIEEVYDGNRSGNMTEDTVCETADDEFNANTKTDATSTTTKDVSQSIREEEDSNLLPADGHQKSHHDGKYTEEIQRVTPDTMASSANSKTSNEYMIESPTNTKSSPPKNNYVYDSMSQGIAGDHGNGSVQKFKIIELRSNGSSTVSGLSEQRSPKQSFFRNIRCHFKSSHRKSKERKNNSDSGNQNDFQKAERQKKKLAKARERRATVVLGLVMGAFLLCWMPFFALYLTSAFCNHCIHPMVFTVFFWIGYCNSAINPIIYTVFNRDFRRAFQKILFKRRYVRH